MRVDVVVSQLSPPPPPMSLTPRSHKRKVPPVLPQDPDEEELQPVPSLPASPAPAPAELVVEDASKEKQDDDGFSPEEEERLRIWDMFAEEYHDSEWLVSAWGREGADGPVQSWQSSHSSTSGPFSCSQSSKRLSRVRALPFSLCSPLTFPPRLHCRAQVLPPVPHRRPLQPYCSRLSHRVHLRSFLCRRGRRSLAVPAADSQLHCQVGACGCSRWGGQGRASGSAVRVCAFLFQLLVCG